MTRTWTQAEIIAFKDAREKLRQSQGLPPFDTLSAGEKKVVLQAQRGEMLKSTQVALKSGAWALNRYPLTAYHALKPGVLELPRHYLSVFGCDKVKFRAGDNLHLLVYRHYDDLIVDPESYQGSNFVADVVIQPKRHEYLGPSPKVAGFRFTEDMAEIGFFDDYLLTTWIGKGNWDIELEFDAVVESWFVIGQS
ncbi:hypothetical protein BJ912DRAFT_905488 [Pholiota molesta]|nr:hypothetical protein BJ912DRAFT_905488 [Pholiota molesta]